MGSQLPLDEPPARTGWLDIARPGFSTTATVLMLAACAGVLACDAASTATSTIPAHFSAVPQPAIDWLPEVYGAPLTSGGPTIDGSLDDPAWESAPWTSDFADIRGHDSPSPRHRTRARMMWDDEYLYLAAEMEEPHVWGTLTERDAVIYHDNDFEVFIDPDADTHQYYELEINALGTVWDLMLLKPYRDGGPAIDAWDISGLRTGVAVDGTLNDPRDEDRGWSVEIAIPWDVLQEAAGRPVPPQAGDRWRVNFSRVQWRAIVEEGRYAKAWLGDPGPHSSSARKRAGRAADHHRREQPCAESVQRRLRDAGRRRSVDGHGAQRSGRLSGDRRGKAAPLLRRIRAERSQGAGLGV